MAVWDDVLDDTDREVFEAAGWGRPAGLGRRPVLLVIDVNYNFVGDRPEPILDSIKRWRYSCGERGWRGVEGHLGNQIVAEVAPRPGDLLVEKKKPSAFFGTPLVGYLVALRADTLLLCGTTTSGCVRASAVDAVSYNFRVGIPEPCVWDRGQLTHKVNLFDLQQKYCDVLELDEVLAYLDGLEPGLFDAEFPPAREARGAAR